MPFSPEIAPQVHTACRNGISEAAEAIGRSFGGKFDVRVEEPQSYAPDSLPADWNGAGLAFVLKTDDSAALVVLSAASGLLPSWYDHPDATGVSKLTTLAQELGMILLPEEYMPMDFAAGAVESVVAALKRCEIASGAGMIRIPITSEGKAGDLTLLWPIPNSSAVLDLPKPAAKPEPPPKPKAPPAPKFEELDEEAALDAKFAALPPYIRSLLRIRVPVSVTLAATQQPISRILEIGPGSIIPFDRHCEQPLELSVGGNAIAAGEAVKLGEKFGLRITEMILPGERFLPLLSAGEELRRAG